MNEELIKYLCHGSGVILSATLITVGIVWHLYRWCICFVDDSKYDPKQIITALIGLVFGNPIKFDSRGCAVGRDGHLIDPEGGLIANIYLWFVLPTFGVVLGAVVYHVPIAVPIVGGCIVALLFARSVRRLYKKLGEYKESLTKHINDKSAHS